MNIIKGDLIKLALENRFDVIIHGCNCFCTMGAGIAKQIKRYFPTAYEKDLLTEKGDKSKLGTITFTEINNLIIVNGYTQYNYKGPGVKVDYNALRKVFNNVKKNFHGKSMAYPKIGAGLAGGDWNIISKIIDEELKDENHTLVIFNN